MTHASQEPGTDEDLLWRLQKGVPLERRPFERIGAALALPEAAVLARVRELLATGVARRFGAGFDAQRLGYASTLCAVDVDDGGLESAAARLLPHPGVTHCYQREGRPNLWFTLTAPAGELAGELDRIAGALRPRPVFHLPARRRFKIEAVFGTPPCTAVAEAGGPGAGLPASPPVEILPLDARARDLVRCLQASLPVVREPFARIARDLGRVSDELLAGLRQWQAAGVMRRVGLIMRHERLGIVANCMCVWQVPPGRIEAAGRCVARNPRVTHCFERSPLPSFPYTLYAMLHGETRAMVEHTVRAVEAEAQLVPGRRLWSVREFKKASPQFFVPPAVGVG